MTRKHGYPIGTTFETRQGKITRLCTVVDLLTTTNAKGEVVKLRYVATHPFLGQLVADFDVNEVTIARGLVRVGLAGAP